MSSLARTAIAAVWVQAIWTASAPSISSLGAAASIIASAAFIESSETPPQGERAAACIWNKEAFTKSLDVVPRALFSRRHQSEFRHAKRTPHCGGPSRVIGIQSGPHG